jgi:TfoX/Sxy family transcriptional regulator of competence genes
MMPNADPATMKLFETLLPDDTRIVVRPMFGHKASFVNGHMFAGTFGPDVFVRLDAPAQEELLAAAGAKRFEPMKGRPMTGYVQIPRRWLGEGTDAKAWIARALGWTASLPPKIRAAKPRRTPAHGVGARRKPAARKSSRGR